MSRELLILRHAKSAWDTDAATDFERPLAKRGKKAAPRVGRFLFQQGLVPDFVVSSPATRARQTVIAVCGQMDISPDQINWDDRIYGGWTASLVSVLTDCPDDARRVLIAGHNPGLETLLQHLCHHRVPIPADGKLLPTAAVAHLQIDSEWSNLDGGVAQLLSITRSRSLSDI
jgi:phosphohistidine phosphatase